MCVCTFDGIDSKNNDQFYDIHMINWVINYIIIDHIKMADKMSI